MTNAPKPAKPKITPAPEALQAVVEETKVLIEQASSNATPPTMPKTLQTGAEQSRTATERSMDQATRTADGFRKATEEAMEFSRGNVEALTKATQTYMSGMQELSKQAFAVMQAMNEQALQNAKALATVKSLRDAMELQTTFAKSQMEKGMAEATKLNEAAFKLAEQSSAPIAARMTLAMERIARPAALQQSAAQ
ncbi:phasin family protein [Teichococcus vastitatis]|uniref:Phasin family protein n=1 Tax=Teichococcus vastitatis TaxID=2307076 RepID=A0ABS9W171_9PROT|nr:phasin family protein [Pseudoroseomonas vastitatis]MCI0752938.1 phasin family protein [Pseudoroseomonas vastitatis]